MDGVVRPDGITDEQFAEAQRLMEISEDAVRKELWRMSCLMACKKNGEMLGQTEFALRDIVLRVGAIVLENAVNERRKKGVTTAAVSLAMGRKMEASASTRRNS